jgi:Flp pilus assembly protein TadD
MRAAFFIALAIAACSGCASIEASRAYRSGTAALDRGDSERAIADLERAAELAPDVSAIQNHLGIAYEGAGRTDEAIAAYERAVELDCDNRAAEKNLSEVRGQVHDLRPSPDGQTHDLRPSPDGDGRNTSQVTP